uniref:Secreted protein n=1 Tax=Arundo donax TaxID=35708 RepID=A0A0A8YB44_ARUDO
MVTSLTFAVSSLSSAAFSLPCQLFHSLLMLCASRSPSNHNNSNGKAIDNNAHITLPIWKSSELVGDLSCT